jgi:diguanylate cyclase (GGDEF)-like protein
MANSENTEEEPKKPIVLIVDDSPANVQILALMFRNLYQVKIATSGAKCIEIANTTPKPNLILLDIMMPEMDGFETIKILKSDRQTSDIPVIFVTGRQDSHDEEKGLKLGAADYIRKPVREAIAISRINTHITLQQQRKRLEDLALHDQLTGLYNRHYLLEVAEHKVASSKRHGHNLSLMMVDIDHFKKINDNHGHQTGDTVLSKLGDFLSTQHRKEDLIAVRFGGEEFVILLENCDLEQATKRAEQIRADIEKLNPAGLDISASIGVASIKSDEQDFQSLLGRADKAVYKAKYEGRNCVIVNDDDDDETT